MPSRFVAAPFILALGFFALLTFYKDGSFAVWMIPFAIVLAVIYALHPQIDWWWYKDHPPRLDKRLEGMIRRLSAFYRGLDVPGKKKFQDRISLYTLANEFLMRGPKENVAAPDDLKVLFAIPVVELTFDQEENWRLKNFQRMIYYPTSFPSPRIHDLHATEMETEDGVILVALDKIKKWVDRPGKAFPLMHYIMARAYLWSFPDKRAKLPEQVDVQALVGASLEDLKQHLGEPEPDLQAVDLAVRTARKIVDLPAGR
ncbi:MAG: hypothetical protein HKN16_11770 [Saprospiraceae bacterium]|nr:hypothetical protein [Saprospiraceae bacterium]